MNGYDGPVELRAECVDGVGDAYQSGPVPFDAGWHLAEASGSRLR